MFLCFYLKRFVYIESIAYIKLINNKIVRIIIVVFLLKFLMICIEGFYVPIIKYGGLYV